MAERSWRGLAPDLRDGCVFCDRIAAEDYEYEYADTVVRFTPLNPVTPGHMLFLPAWHAEHPHAEAVRVSMSYAATYANSQGEDFNLITSSGPAATQSVAHIHCHYVPRRPGDGLHLPWTGQKKPRAAA
ncbi:HIT family protein [Nocardia xishanensis]|uniref:HIT family protein n=1 Tax=Nocardia xishanensis TaxID=238964 RepID=UPI000A01DF70|nr:HIT domain-containing protein [Nocardia xishanensis]